MDIKNLIKRLAESRHVMDHEKTRLYTAKQRRISAESDLADKIKLEIRRNEEATETYKQEADQEEERFKFIQESINQLEKPTDEIDLNEIHNEIEQIIKSENKKEEHSIFLRESVRLLVEDQEDLHSGYDSTEEKSHVDDFPI